MQSSPDMARTRALHGPPACDATTVRLREPRALSHVKLPAARGSTKPAGTGSGWPLRTNSTSSSASQGEPWRLEPSENPAEATLRLGGRWPRGPGAGLPEAESELRPFQGQPASYTPRSPWFPGSRRPPRPLLAGSPGTDEAAPVGRPQLPNAGPEFRTLGLRWGLMQEESSHLSLGRSRLGSRAPADQLCDLGHLLTLSEPCFLKPII